MHRDQGRYYSNYTILYNIIQYYTIPCDTTRNETTLPRYTILYDRISQIFPKSLKSQTRRHPRDPTRHPEHEKTLKDSQKILLESKFGVQGWPKAPQWHQLAPKGTPRDPKGTPKDLPKTPKGTSKNTPEEVRESGKPGILISSPFHGF